MKQINAETIPEKVTRLTRYVRLMRKAHPDYAVRRVAQDGVEEYVLDLLEGVRG